MEGTGAVITLASWLGLLGRRGQTVPQMGKYCLMVFSEALDVLIPPTHPAVIKAAKIRKAAPQQAPAAPLGFIFRIGKEARIRENPEGLRIYCSLTFILAMASLRFADTSEVARLFVSESAVIGVSIDPKDKDGSEMTCETPANGINSEGAWVRPLIRLWGAIEPRAGKYTFLFPNVDSEWKFNPRKRGTDGVVRNAIARMESKFGFWDVVKLHSPRNFFATCAGQILYSREHREKLGRWAPCSVMPDRYDRAVCATELRLRSEILAKIRDGCCPAKPFEVPRVESTQLEGGEHPTQKTEIADSSVSETSEAELSDDITQLFDYV